MQQPNNSSVQPGGRQASTSTNSSNEPQGGLRNPTDEPYFWNDDIHKDIIEDCNRQDHINWEHKLEALANLLALAEAKRARTTLHGWHNTRYIGASRHVREAHDAMDWHSQSWTTCVAKPGLATNDESSGQAPNVSAPPPGSTTHRITTRRGNEEY